MVSWHPSASQIVDLYERHASAWDNDRAKNLFERGWLDRFLPTVLPEPAILDLGCGSGEPIARYLIERNCRVTGVDASSSMIAMCEARYPAHSWVIGDMRNVRLGRRFNGILAWDSFFHLTPDDQRRAFATFEAHADAGGVLMFTSGPLGGEALGSYRGEDLYHASLDPTDYEALLTNHGFEVVNHVAEDKTCGGRTVWLAKSVGK